MVVGSGGLTFTVSSHTKELDDAKEEEENRDPNTDIYLLPELNGDTSGSDFKG